MDFSYFDQRLPPPEKRADRLREERGDLGIRDMEVGVEPTEANFSARLRAGFSARAIHLSGEPMSNHEADYNGNREE